MNHGRCAISGLMLTLACCGCGGGSNASSSDGSAQPQTAAQAAVATPTAKEGGPKQALTEFLSAIKAGDDERAAGMLTTLARQKTSELGLNVAPPGSDTASFEITDMELVGANGARVACRWSELDADGKRSSDTVVWMMAKEPAGWRIAGMVAKVFPDLDAIVFNFEDPEDMIRKQELAQQEMERRAQTAESQAAPPQRSGDASTSKSGGDTEHTAGGHPPTSR